MAAPVAAMATSLGPVGSLRCRLSCLHWMVPGRGFY